ncbi:MAG: DUF2891 domain-containing protein [Gammaproteobacteria bacterium]|nr:DUF2891 domain-containing protein [Gammaproteobacteria bacterium]
MAQQPETLTVDNAPVAQGVTSVEKPRLSLAEANKLIELPLSCVEREYPNKLQQTLESDADLLPPRQLHPVFYGCFDWHSAAHGYWSLVTLLQHFPELAKAAELRTLLKRNITAEKVAIELEYFEKDINKSFERTYGWAWLLQLAQALHSWDDPLARELEANLAPLSTHIVGKYLAFLPKLVYPIRVGEHTNTAFGLTFAYDYAKAMQEKELLQLIEERARSFYLADAACPINWEPSGFDFLSPCLEQLNLLRRILSEDEFLPWVSAFLPQLKNPDYQLDVGLVGDRSDGKLVHLDGVNFSRAWVLYGLANQYSDYAHLGGIADQHVAYSYPNLLGDDYEGGHWLASFAIYALTRQGQN